MNTIETVVLIVHTFIAVMLIVLVLLQRGKGADAGAAFGAGASGTVFGARGSSNFFSRATAILATAFFVSSLTLAYLTSQHTDVPESLLESAPPVQPEASTPDESAAPAEESQQTPEMPALPDDNAAPAESDAQLPELEPGQPPDNEEQP